MAKLPGLQLEQFSEALRAAFSYDDLEMMLQFRLEKKLQNLSLAKNYEKIAFDVIMKAEAQGWTDRLLKAARDSNPGNPELLAFSQQFGLAPTGTPSRKDILERYIKPTNAYLDVMQWRTRLGEIEGQVCRVEVNTNKGMVYGTGFLLGPDVIITNHHVIDSVIAGVEGKTNAQGLSAKPTDVTLRFDYKKLTSGTVFEGTTFKLAENWLIDQSPPSKVDFELDPKSADPGVQELDHALLRLSRPAGALPIGEKAQPESPKRGWMVPRTEPYDFEANKPLFIVQHPKGDPLILALDTEAAPKANGNRTRIRYTTNTEKGSSGSPCFSVNWELIALHHGGDPDYTFGHTPTYNEGIPFQTILELLESRNLADVLGEQPL